MHPLENTKKNVQNCFSNPSSWRVWFLRDDVSNTWWQVCILKSLYKHEIKHLTMCYWKISFSVQPHSAFSLSVSFTKEFSIKCCFLVMGDLFCSAEDIFWSSVSYVALLICFPSHMYECVIKARKIGQHQSVSLSAVLLKTARLSVPVFHDFLVAVYSLFLYLWGSEMNFRKQVISLPGKYVVTNFHMVSGKCFFHFISIVDDCFVRNFCPLGNWKPPGTKKRRN